MGLLWAFVAVSGVGAPGGDDASAARRQAVEAFTGRCVAACESGGVEGAECRAYCDCVLDGMAAAGVLDAALVNRLTPSQQTTVDKLVAACRPGGLRP
jgi:hypothetical protein